MSERNLDSAVSNPSLGTPEERLVEAMARRTLDDAYRWGDRLHGWDDSGEDVRETFRMGARYQLTALLANRQDLLEVLGLVVANNVPERQTKLYERIEAQYAILDAQGVELDEWDRMSRSSNLRRLRAEPLYRFAPIPTSEETP